MTQPAFFDPRPISRKPRPHADSEMMVSHFNKLHPVGSPIRVWKGHREDGPGIETTVAEPGAFILGGHTAVVKVPGDSIALTHVEVVQ